MIEQPSTCPSAPAKSFPLLGTVILICAVFACSIYANLSFTVTDKDDLQFFPPFKPRVNANDNQHLGGEYYNMARSLVAGQGFAHPFDKPTGPTAWQPPVLPLILAGLLWMFDGDREAVTAVIVFLQVFVLIGTGILVLALIRQTTARLWSAVAVMMFLLSLLCEFRLCFQNTHDSWFVLLALDLLIAGLYWLRPLLRWQTAVGWGLFGGLCVLVNPIVGFTWGLLSLLFGIHQRSVSRLALAALVAGLALTPWIVRNYLVFGRFVPAKSNLAYELYQSECLQKDGLLQGRTFGSHPYASNHRERQEYNTLGEVAYLDKKRGQFCQAVWADPQDFIERVAYRFAGATFWYVPFNRDMPTKRPWVFWLSRLVHPLPFLALLVLLGSAVWKPLHGAQGMVIAVYLFYLLPYVGASYYERYGMPLLGIKVLLVIWAAERLLSLLLSPFMLRAVYPKRQCRSALLPLPRAQQNQPAQTHARTPSASSSPTVQTSQAGVKNSSP
jgi:hypothetical protein